jgi:hypothetical protein
MKINKEGTIRFSFDTNENPKAFKEPNFVKWVDFQIDNNKGTIYSEGETLNVTIFLESSDEFSIFKTKIIPENGLNKIAVAWSPDEIKLFMNGEKTQSLNPNDFKF